MSQTDSLTTAYEKGYRVNKEGRVVSPFSGKTLGVMYNDHGYHVFSVSVNVEGVRRTRAVKVHRLAALQKFGLEELLASECVRHLNGNREDNRLVNIGLGTHRENSMDRNPSDRLTQSILATSKNMRKDWDLIDKDRSLGLTYNELVAKYGVSKGALSYRYSDIGKRRRKTDL